jgi:hypothetical protein
MNLSSLCLHIWHFCFPQTSNIPVFPHFCRLLPPLFPINTNTCLSVFFWAGILNELSFTFCYVYHKYSDIKECWGTGCFAFYSLDRQTFSISLGFLCQLSLSTEWMLLCWGQSSAYWPIYVYKTELNYGMVFVLWEPTNKKAGGNEIELLNILMERNWDTVS